MPGPQAGLLSPKNASYNYQSKKARIQNWNNLFRLNQKLDVETQLRGYEMRKEPRSFLLSFKGVHGIPHMEASVTPGGGMQMPMMNSAKYYMEYYVTLFNKDIGMNGGFYGRTYRSQAYALREAGGSWDLDQEEFVYFHTNYTDKSSFLVVECVIVRDIAGLRTYSSGGYALCDVFQFKGIEVVDLVKGSPRNIGILGLEAAMRGQKT